MLPARHVTLSMSGKIANILGPHYGWSLWKNEDLLADLVEFFCSGSAVQRSLWARLEKRVPVSEAEKKRRRTEAANAVTPLSVVDLVLLLKIPRRRYPACALQGIAARWLSAHYKTIAHSIAHAMARGLGFVTPCPNKQGKNAYFSVVSDASSTACDAVNVREDCKHFGPPLWVVPVEERGPFGGPS